MPSNTKPSGSNPRLASQPQDDGVNISSIASQSSSSSIAPQPQRQVVTLPSTNVPVSPSSSRNEVQDDVMSLIKVKEEDTRLPPASILRMIKAALPADAKVAKPAKEDMERYAAEFISFLASEAAEISSSSRRETMTGNDVLKAMGNTGFEHYAQALRPYLEGYKAQGGGRTVNLEVEDEGMAAVAAQRRRDRIPTPELPPSLP